MNEAAILPLGTQVRVSDGTTCPPARFNKKLAAWKHANYEGVVVEYKPEFGGYTIQRKPASGWRMNPYMILLSSGTRPERVQAIPGAVLVPVKGDGMSVTVDEPAMLAIEAAAQQQHAA